MYSRYHNPETRITRKKVTGTVGTQSGKTTSVLAPIPKVNFKPLVSVDFAFPIHSMYMSNCFHNQKYRVEPEYLMLKELRCNHKLLKISLNDCPVSIRAECPLKVKFY